KDMEQTPVVPLWPLHECLKFAQRVPGLLWIRWSLWITHVLGGLPGDSCHNSIRTTLDQRARAHLAVRNPDPRSRLDVGGGEAIARANRVHPDAVVPGSRVEVGVQGSHVSFLAGFFSDTNAPESRSASSRVQSLGTTTVA